MPTGNIKKVIAALALQGAMAGTPPPVDKKHARETLRTNINAHGQQKQEKGAHDYTTNAGQLFLTSQMVQQMKDLGYTVKETKKLPLNRVRHIIDNNVRADGTKGGKRKTKRKKSIRRKSMRRKSTRKRR